MPLPGVLRFQCSPDVSPQIVGSGWISEPQGGPTVGVGIIGADGVLRFGCSRHVSPQELGSGTSGWICEPQRGPTVGVGIIAPARCAAISVLPRRLSPGSRFWLHFRAPADSRSWNHCSRLWCCDFSMRKRFRSDPVAVQTPAFFSLLPAPSYSSVLLPCFLLPPCPSSFIPFASFLRSEFSRFS